MGNVTFELTKINGEPAISLNVEGTYRKRIYQFDKVWGAECAAEMLQTVDELIEAGEEFTTGSDGEGGIVIAVRGRESNLFSFDDNDAGTAYQVIHNYLALALADSGEDEEDETED